MLGGRGRRFVGVVAASAVIGLAVPAAADEVANGLDGTVDATLETTAIPSGGSTSVGFSIVSSDSVPSGDAAGCNATSTNPATISLDVPAGVTASAASLQFTDCGVTQSVDLSSSTPGSYTISVSSVTGGEPGSLWDSAPASLTLDVNGSSLSYTGDTSGTVGQYATLSAGLTANPGSGALAGKTVTFTLGSGGSAQSVNAVTDGSGIASTTSIVPDQDAGSVPLSISFAGDTSYGPSTANPAFSLAKAPTAVVLTSPSSILPNGTLNLSATLTTPVVTTSGTTNTALAGRTLTFDVCPVPSGTCTTLTGSSTDSSGVSNASTTWSGGAGDFSVTSTFAATGEARHLGSSSSASNLAVNGSLVAYTGDATATVGQYATLSAMLTGVPGGLGLADRTVTFTLGAGGSAQSVDATTNGSGVASTTAMVPAQDAGSVPISASFAGDASSGGSSATTSVTVSKAASAVALTSPTSILTGQTLNLSATLTTPVVTTSGTTNTALVGRPVSFHLCPLVGPCTDLTGTVTNATGVSTVSIGWVLAAGTYAVTADFAGTGETRYLGATSPAKTLSARYKSTLDVVTYGGKYRSGVTVKATLRYVGQVGTPVLPGKTVKFYKMASSTATSVANATLIGTATTGPDGVASVLYRMDVLATPPLPGAKLGFAAVFSAPFGSYSSVQSATMRRDVSMRTPKIVLVGNRVGTKLSGSVKLTDAPITFVTVSNGVPTSTTISLPIPGKVLTLRFLSSSNVVVGSFNTVATNSSGVAFYTNRTIPAGAVKASAKWGGSSSYYPALSNVVVF